MQGPVKTYPDKLKTGEMFSKLLSKYLAHFSAVHYTPDLFLKASFLVNKTPFSLVWTVGKTEEKYPD